MTLYASTFISVGYLCNGFINLSNKWLYCVVSMLFIAIYVSCGKNISIGSQDIFTVVPYTITAVGGSLLVVCVSYKLNNKYLTKSIGALAFLGSHTLEIMALHFISFKIVNLLIIVVYGLPIQQLAEYPVIMEYSEKGWWIIYTIVGVVFPLLFAEIILITKHLAYKNNVFGKQ